MPDVIIDEKNNEATIYFTIEEMVRLKEDAGHQYMTLEKYLIAVIDERKDSY